jgi:dihydroorotate dehydrogenase electron transfer subunit
MDLILTASRKSSSSEEEPVFSADVCARKGEGKRDFYNRRKRFRGKEDAFLLDDCESLAGKACFTSDAGDFGIHGNVLSALDTLSSEDTSGAAVFAVGPEIMMRKVSEWAAERGLSCQVSLERRMACGIGICLVCVCKVKAEEKGIPFHHIRCCKEGPVMNASEVIW